MSEITPQLALYSDLLAEIKSRIRAAQNRAAISANAEMILLYWDIVRMIAARQEREGWGAGVIPKLAVDLKNELPEEKGFSERNLKRMLRFFREYPAMAEKVSQPASLLQGDQNQSDGIVPQPAAQLIQAPTTASTQAPSHHPFSIWSRSVPQLPNRSFAKSFRPLTSATLQANLFQSSLRVASAKGRGAVAERRGPCFFP